ncbi:ANTH domain-domain-containing protein [Catenaria anguillulae PL171]|uniref:ANTH domain-domain-containing protein n=1 Tax=Catenaria anguillulae PL171 TaxID=765915 RepID=A0A1Y2I418_9FUNG|nr:ANTH domain-domain-containing protein [Catenaria anguillulae PL171]
MYSFLQQPPVTASAAAPASTSAANANTMYSSAPRPLGAQPTGGMGRAINKAKSEQDLMLAIRKATSPDETSPKQKHVRTCIVYTWDHKTSAPFWLGLKNSPVLANEVQCFKALITIHKVIRQGHPTTLPEAIMELPWLESLPRMLAADFQGYSGLIRGYLEFLSYKLHFHRIHPDFTGTFDYEEYTTLKGTADPNEGYETISELMGLQNRLDAFQRTIFASLRSSPNLECRLSALVPLIEESYAIYRFITSMLRAIHARVGSLDALEPLRKNYTAQYFMLKDFYHTAGQYRYLTSLITIPSLGDQPPSLYDSDAVVPTMPARPPTPPQEIEDDDTGNGLVDAQADLWAQFNADQQRREQELEAERQRQLAAQQQLAAAAQEEQWLAAVRERDQRLTEFSEQLMRARQQYERDQQLLQQYDAKLREVQAQLQAVGGAQSEAVKKMQDELAQWKAKYEALAKLYAQLRQEHLELLTKYKALAAQNQQGTVTADQIAKLQAQLNAKNLQLAELIAARDAFKTQAEMAKQVDDELEALRLQARNAEQELGRLRREKEEEILVLQSGMDQSLLALAEMKRRLEEGTGSGDAAIAEAERAHAARLDAILDAILAACAQKAQQAGSELENPALVGNVTATPEYTLSVVDQVIAEGTHFAQAFVAYLVGGDQSHAITSANSFAYNFSALLSHAKGCTRLAEDENVVDEVVLTGKQAVMATVRMFTALTSAQLGGVDASARPAHVQQLAGSVAGQIQRLAGVIEKLVKSKSSVMAAGANLETLVDNEMQAASRAIEEASAKLQALLSTPLLDASPAQVQVNSAILAAAMALIQAIANLIRCATLTQQEIAAHGKGATGGSAAAFYKKHHRWTEGLISAAKAVAFATGHLVETADGMVQGTKSMEQLVVSANEVGAATAQLVAASRVKSVDGSKTQDKLEAAATSVTMATRVLVKAAKDAARKLHEDSIMANFSQLSIHDLKTQEMEQQVKILTLEKELVAARSVLAQMRKASYHNIE